MSHDTSRFPDASNKNRATEMAACIGCTLFPFPRRAAVQDVRRRGDGDSKAARVNESLFGEAGDICDTLALAPSTDETTEKLRHGPFNPHKANNT